MLRERWKRLERWVKAAAPVRSLDQAVTPGGDGEPGRSVRLLGLAAGDYYVIAIENIRWDATRDPGVLDKLIPAATRVTLPAGQLIEVSLPRRRLADLVR